MTFIFPRGQHSTLKNQLLTLLALAICVIHLFPLYWIIISSLKTNAEIFQSPPTFFPTKLCFDPYIGQLAGKFSIYRPLLNSFIIASSSMVIAIFLAVPAAYGLARYKIRGRSIFIMMFLVTQMLPVTLLLTPLYLTYAKIGILNTYLAPILSNCTSSIPFIVLILRTYFLGLPKSLEDAAKIDGCNTFQTFIRVMLPVSRSGLIMAASFSFLFAWNDLVYAMTFMTRQILWPMTTGMYNFMGKYGTEWNYVMAYATLLIIPVIFIFIFLQKYIVGGLTQGAVKG